MWNPKEIHNLLDSCHQTMPKAKFINSSQIGITHRGKAWGTLRKSKRAWLRLAKYNWDFFFTCLYSSPIEMHGELCKRITLIHLNGICTGKLLGGLHPHGFKWAGG